MAVRPCPALAFRCLFITFSLPCLGLPLPFHCFSVTFHCFSTALPWPSTAFSLSILDF